MICDAPTRGLSVCAENSLANGGCQPRHNAYGQQLCEVCETRLYRTKGMKYKCGPGLMCHKCYDKSHQAAATKRPLVASSDTKPAPAPKRVRRTQSDPGEATSLTRKRTRAQPPATEPEVEKTCARAPTVDPSLQLDQAHAQRLALLAAVAADAAHCVSNASAVVFDT